MNTRLPSRSLRRITRLCAKRHERFYSVVKLRSDPVYAAVTKELLGAPLPVLDIGCGIGLLAFYLRESGFAPAIAGFDYDAQKISFAKSMVALSDCEGLSFMNGDARAGLPECSGHVVILDILQFFTRQEQEALLKAAASWGHELFEELVAECGSDPHAQEALPVSRASNTAATASLSSGPPAHDASIRAFKASASSRAAVAMSFTTSNSSRLTKPSARTPPSRSRSPIRAWLALMRKPSRSS